MIKFAAGVLTGSFGVALAIVSRSRYVSKRQKWSESERPTPVPARFRVETQGHPAGQATVRTAHIRSLPRKQP